MGTSYCSFDTCGPRTSPLQRLWPLVKKYWPRIFEHDPHNKSDNKKLGSIFDTAGLEITTTLVTSKRIVDISTAKFYNVLLLL